MTSSRPSSLRRFSRAPATIIGEILCIAGLSGLGAALPQAGVAPAAILEGSITANGLPLTRRTGAFIGDFDGDGLFEFRAWFNESRLVATMPDGEAFLVLAGRLTDGRFFESIADVKVVNLMGGVQ